MTPDAVLVLCSCPDSGSAQAIATALVGQRLAACVNLLSGVTSVYRWENRVQTEQEVMLLIKTRQPLLDQLHAAVLQLHPNELPELIHVPITGGSADYLQWIGKETS